MRVGLVDFESAGHHTPYAKYISEHLIELDHEVVFITSEANDELSEFPNGPNFSVETVRSVTHSNIPYIQQAQVQINRSRQIKDTLELDLNLDLIHFLFLDLSEIPIWFNLRNQSNKLPIIASLHRDEPFDSNYETDEYGYLSLKLRTLAENIFTGINDKLKSRMVDNHRLKKIIVHDQNIQRRLARKTGIDEQFIENIPAPTPEVNADITKKEARDILNLPKKGTMYLFFGELRYEKGPDILAEAVSDLPDDDFFVTYAGKEKEITREDIPEWDELVDRNLLIPRLEYIPEKQVDYYFIASDALVLPYRRKMGISGPLRRACMARTHVIGPNDTDVGDVIERNNLGTTFEHNSVSALKGSLEDFVKNKDEYDLAGVDKYKKSIHYSTVVEELENIYQSCL
ncbi:glycosyltransferase family 4 protein [Haloferax sp. S1W]|uniref:glycosyltransferase family 4 protein n=1 Tax=Haloferax sp. S1W TaxID=3377110 RepID=UPI0037C679DC